MSDWNTNIIEEFRTHQGKVGGGFDGAPSCCCMPPGAGPARNA